MIQGVLDANSYLLRDYYSFLKNSIEKIANMTSRWSDFTVSEPDTIFISNLGYVHDLLSFCVDSRYITTSVRYTEDKSFLDTLCVLTGGYYPAYSESYSLEMTNGSRVNTYMFPQGYILTDSTGKYSATVLHDTIMLPNTKAYVAAVPGAVYNYTMRDNNRRTFLKTEDAINRHSAFSFSLGIPMQTTERCSDVIYSFLTKADSQNSYKYILAGKDTDTLIFAPKNRYSTGEFLGFSLDESNTLAPNSPMEMQDGVVQATFLRTKTGTQPVDINDTKISYLESLRKIETDINPAVFKSALEARGYDNLERATLEFVNSRDTFVSSSEVNYQKGYIDISGDIPAGTTIKITYDYYTASKPTEYKRNINPIEIYVAKESTFYSIDLKTETGQTIKANSLIVEMRNGDNFCYLTDYDSRLIVPRGLDTAQCYRYLFKDDSYYYETVLVPGRCTRVAWETMEGTQNINILLAVPEDCVASVLGNEYSLTGKKLNLINVSVPMELASVPVLIDGELVYHAQINSCVYFDDAVLKSGDLPPMVTLTDNAIYFMPEQDMTGQAVEVRIGEEMTFSKSITADMLQYLGTGKSLSVYRMPIPTQYTEKFGTPERAGITIDGRTFCTDSRKDRSYKNFCNPLVSTELAGKAIDLYDIAKTFSKVERRYIPVLRAKVYLLPTDLLNSTIEQSITEAVNKYFDALEIGEDVRVSTLVSKIIHSNEYISYVQLQEPLQDIVASPNQLITLQSISITFRNADVILY